MKDESIVIAGNEGFVTKFGLTGVFGVLSAACIFGKAPESFSDWICRIMFYTAFAVTFVWSRHVVSLKICGDEFIMFNGFSTRKVPVRNLIRAQINLKGLDPCIDIYFNPECPFGQYVRIVPPSLRYAPGKEFYARAEILLKIAEANVNASMKGKLPSIERGQR